MTAPTSTAPQSDEPLIPRPSSRTRETTGSSRGLAQSLGWLGLTLAVGMYGVLFLVGVTSLLGVILACLVVVALAPWLGRVGAQVTGFDLGGLLRVSLALKLLATLPRYQGRDDSVIYHRVGAVLADRFRALDFGVETGRSIPGTGTVRYLTGLIEVVTFEDEFATFLVFSLFGFVGVVWFLQAFIVGLPGLEVRRYAVLVLLWPSLLYWPSSIGKEAVMLLALGAAARGVAGLLHGRRSGVVWLLGGLALAVLVRPHVVLIVVTAAMCATVLRGVSRGGVGAIGRMALVSILVFAGSIAADAIERLLDIDGLSPSGLTAALDLAESRSAQGGSSFDAARIDGIVEYPWGFVTVLFRPFPLEAPTAAMLLTALEGAVLAGLVIAAVPRILAAVGSLRDEAYLVYCAVFVAVFVYLFSALANFGILARQRTTALPLVLALIALPTARERVGRRRRLQVVP